MKTKKQLHFRAALRGSKCNSFELYVVFTSDLTRSQGIPFSNVIPQKKKFLHLNYLLCQINSYIKNYPEINFYKTIGPNRERET